MCDSHVVPSDDVQPQLNLLHSTASRVHPLMATLLSQGTLKGFDQTVNIVLEGSHERVYSASSGVEQVQLGLYIIRGDNM